MLRLHFIYLILLLGLSSSFAQNKLAAGAWREDIDSLQSQLPALHPNFFAAYPRKDFEKDLQNLKAHLTDKSDFRIALELQTILAKAGDAQTRLDLTELMMGEKVIPYALSVFAGELYVSATMQRFEKIGGAKIVKVNNFTTKEALAKMACFVAQENEYTTQRDALTLFRFPEALRLAGVTTTDTLALLVEKNGKQDLVKLYPLDPAKPPSRIESSPVVIQPKRPDLRWQQIQTFFMYQWLPNDSVLYIQYNHCLSRELSLAIGDTLQASQYPSFNEFADTVMALVDRMPYAKILVDLRFNPGGDPADGNAWAKRLAALPKGKRPAQLFVATNLFTQGAAVEVAMTFQSVGAVLLGEPSGTRPNHYDIVRQFYLPNSHLPVLCGMEYRQLQKSKSTVLHPKVLIPVTFQDFRDGTDPVLDYVRKQ